MSCSGCLAKSQRRWRIRKQAHSSTGNGIAKPRGFLTLDTAATADDTRAWGTLEHVTTGISGSLGDTDKLIDLVSRLKPQYRAGAVWMMNRFTAAAVQKMKDGEGRPIWLQGIQSGQPNTLLGFPVIESEQMPDIAVNSLSIAFGNFKKGYTIVRRLGVRFLLDPYTNKPNVKLYTFSRVGGDVNNSEAIKLMKFAA
jgi:HK97 family phage major capsid protein